MSDDEPSDLCQRLQQGDPLAATELVHRYEPELRRAVRVRLTDPRLRRLLDSADVCQSVFAQFFVRVSLGAYDLQDSGDLAALLMTMARHKLLDKVRWMKSLRRDQQRLADADSQVMNQVTERQPGPDEQAVHNDLLSEVRRRLTEQERQLVDLRIEGHEWEEISIEMSAGADALRKKLKRGLDRVSEELGLAEMPE
ncbi:MAG: sigma-70 family RNA polymerase sigma factor [Pirellulales bacterium]|nr:sigma-70 family RNA polymerase sigma factor [Pirellulales bacterium]